MTTNEMQQDIVRSGEGHYMHREEFAGLNSNGGLKSCHRWVIHDRDGNRIAQGVNPRQCYRHWLNVRLARKGGAL